MPEAWQEEAGDAFASEHWKAQREVLELPVCDWRQRRRFCAETRGCEACARYVSDGKDFEYAPSSQKMINILCSPGAYGSAAGAHAAGRRWNAQPNHGSASHAHQWWPPQAACDDVLPAGTKLPIGTYKALELVDAMFAGE